jgi:hypothetical protein
MNVNIPEKTRPPPELMARGYMQDEDDESDGNSASELEGETLMLAAQSSYVVGLTPSNIFLYANAIMAAWKAAVPRISRDLSCTVDGLNECLPRLAAATCGLFRKSQPVHHYRNANHGSLYNLLHEPGS